MPRSSDTAVCESRPPENRPRRRRVSGKGIQYVAAQRECVLEMHEALDRARRGVLAFTAFTMPEYEINWHHMVMAREVNRFVRGEIKRLIITLPPRFGKALQIDTPIPTPSGFTPIGRLQPGDWIFDDKGLPCQVIARSPIWHNRPVFSVESKGGEKILADANHEWLVQLCRKSKKFKLKTTEYLANRKSQRAASIKIQGQLSLPEKTLVIDPWVLGVWLGDGCSHHATITSHDDDSVFYRKEFEKRGYETSNRKTNQSFGVLGGFFKKIVKMKLRGNKHIPNDYLRSSVTQRMELLQGLIDTDGHISKFGAVEFCNTNESLAYGVYELVSSLGAKAHISLSRSKLYGKDCGPRWRVHFFLAGCALLPRKRQKTRSSKKFVHRQIRVVPFGRADTCCIQVDSPSSMFLAGRSMLPTHNSELLSRRLPAYLLGRNPNEQIISCSYSADLSSRINRDVQRIIDDRAYAQVFPDTRLHGSNSRSKGSGNYLRNSDMFEIVGHKGVYKSSGVGGPITGAGMSTGIIDDALKNAEDANSATVRDRIWEWYNSTFYTRLEKGARIAIIMTRWHQSDLVGRLLETAKKDPSAEQWRLVNLPAVNELGPGELDPRQPGEVLWPEKYDAKTMDLMRRTMGAKVWSSLYQQAPAPMEGGIIKRAWWRYYSVAPSDLTGFLISMDTTFKDKAKSDYVAIQVWARRKSEPASRYAIAQMRDRMSYVTFKAAVRQVCAAYPMAREILVEDTANGAALISDLGREIQGLIPISPKGSKIARVEAITPQIEAGNVYLPQDEPWTGHLVEECAVFPNGANDDCVDAMSQALQRMMPKATDLRPGRIISLTKTSQW